MSSAVTSEHWVVSTITGYYLFGSLSLLPFLLAGIFLKGISPLLPIVLISDSKLRVSNL